MRSLSGIQKIFAVSMLVAVLGGAYVFWQAFGETIIGMTIDSNRDLREGLVLHYTFDGPNMDLSQTSAEIRDRSGSANHGNWFNFSTTSTQSGRLGQALSFTGYADYASTTDTADLDFTDTEDFTIALWVKPTGSTTQTFTAATSTYTTTGTTTFLVPQTTSITIKAWGGGGGSGGNGGTVNSVGGNGGGGGFTQTTVTTTPGESLYVLVGGGGGGGDQISCDYSAGGGGGGYSGVHRNYSYVAVAAGGGGGGSGSDANAEDGGAGAAGGGTSGGTGTTGASGGGVGGGPGTPTSGGAGGTGTAGIDGTAGSLLQGGAGGGNGSVCLGTAGVVGGGAGGGAAATGSGGGGGGGGGYYGGGGAESGSNAAVESGGGGGGGSSYATGTASSTTAGSGVNAGNNTNFAYQSGKGVGATAPTPTNQNGNPGGDGLVVITYGATTTISVTSTSTLLSKSDSTDGGYKLYVEADGDLCFAIDDDGTWGPEDTVCTSGYNYYDNTWHNVMVQKDGTTGLYLYVDNPDIPVAQDTSFTSNTSLENAASFTLGKDVQGSTGYGTYTGGIDDVRVYTRLLTADQRSRLYDLGNTTRVGVTLRNQYHEEGLVGYYTFDGKDVYIGYTPHLRNIAATTSEFAYGTTSVNVEDTVSILGTSANAYLGNSVSGGGDVNGDGYKDILMGSYPNENVFIFHGPLNLTSTSTLASNANATLVGEGSNSRFGWSVSNAGDVNNDGFDDVLVGAYAATASSGKAYLFYGPLSGTVNAANADAIFTGTASNHEFGRSVSGAGDVNNDGYDDIIIGANGAVDTDATCTTTNCGRAYLFFGPLSGSVDAASANAIFNGTSNSDYFGWDVSRAGDVDGDGYDDVLIGASDASDTGTARGRAYVFLGPLTGSINAENADTIINGTNDSDYFSQFVSNAGDVNNDGYDDILVAGHNAEDADATCTAVTGNCGRAYLFLGPLTASINAEDASAIFNGTNNTDNFGWDVASAGDVNADGYDDLLIGAYLAEDAGTERGRAYIFLGPKTGSVNAENADTIFNGYVDSDRFGYSVAGVGDTNNDGFEDVVMGAYLGGSSDYGSVYVFTPYGKGRATSTSLTPATGRIGQGLEFNGTSDYASVGSMTSAGSIRSISFWIRPDDNTSRGILKVSDIAKVELDSAGNATTTGSGWTSPTIYVNAVQGTAVSQSEWSHITIVNGADITTATNTVFGLVAGSYYDGKMDDLRFYNKVLTQDDISRISGLGNTTRINVSQNNKQTTNLIGHWSFNGPDMDLSSTTKKAYNTLATTTHVATSTSFSVTSGRVGQGVNFNGTSDYARVGNMGTDPVKSISFWIRAEDTTTRGVINLNATTYIELDGSSQITATGLSSPTYYVDGIKDARTIDNDWHHVVVTSTTGTSSTNVEFGRVSSSYFHGKLDEIRFYAVPLTFEEVQRLVDKQQAVFICGRSTVTDQDSNVYNTVPIGGQCWMKQSMRVGTRINGVTAQTNNSVIERWCNSDTDSNCTDNHPNYPDGGLYSWGEAMQYSITPGAQGVCPSGWHIPTDTEFKTLEMHLGMSQAIADTTGYRGTTEGTQMKPNGSSGFEGNLAGGTSAGRDLSANFWTSSDDSGGWAWSRQLRPSNTNVYRGTGLHEDGRSVRCLKD